MLALSFSRALVSIDKYLQYLEIHKNASIFTIRNYNLCLSRFTKEMNIGADSDINLDAVYRFKLILRGQNLSNNWIEFHIVVIREYLKWCLKNDIPTLAYYKIETGKYEPPNIQVLEREEIEKLFHIPHPKLLISLRNTAIMRLLYSTGCRVSELISIQRWQINDRGELAITGKGKRVRIVFISDESLGAVKKYLDQRGDGYPSLFISHGRNRGKALSKEMIELIVRKYAKLCGITKRTTPHKIRHTFATQLLKNGAPLPAIQQMLGHSSVQTTQLYLHVTNPELKASHRKYHL